jgi:2,5-diketo-D-gluconate reductase B
MDTIITGGVSIPRLGFGTFRMPGGGCQPVVESALALGYRHLDTAAMYENEDAVGTAIAAPPKDQRYVTPPFASDWNALTL